MVGDISEALIDNGGLGLTDPLTAEVHVIVRYHGPVVPALMPGMINSVGGGCDDPDTEPVEGFACFDPQAVAFLAP